MQTLSQLLNIQTVTNPNGSISLFTTSGLSLQTNDRRESVQPSDRVHIGSIPLSRRHLRDHAEWGRRHQRDDGRPDRRPTSPCATPPCRLTSRNWTEFAQGLSSPFAGQGLDLVPTDGSGNVPAVFHLVQAGYVGYAGTIQVNPAVTADPSLVRARHQHRRCHRLHPQSAGRLRLHHTDLERVELHVRYQLHSGVAQPAMNTSGLGPNGKLTAHLQRHRRRAVGFRNQPRRVPGPAERGDHQRRDDRAGAADQPEREGDGGQRRQYGHRGVADAQPAERLWRQRPGGCRRAGDVHRTAAGILNEHHDWQRLLPIADPDQQQHDCPSAAPIP